MGENLIQRVSVYHKRPEDGKILTVEWEGGEFKGCRGLPHGTVESGETLEQTAVRECQEETGLTPVLGRRIYSYDTINAKVHVTIIEASSVSGTMHQQLKAGYMSEDEILKRDDVHPKLKELTSEIRRHGSIETLVVYRTLLYGNP